MLINELKLKTKKKAKKRVGRGGKRGTYSGRGQKGQKARAGHRIKPAEKYLIYKLPKLRGVKNKLKREKPIIFNLDDLERKFSDTNIIDKKYLLDKKIIKKLNQRVKILGDGEIKKAFEIKGIEVSKKAKEKIEKVGGKVL